MLNLQNINIAKGRTSAYDPLVFQNSGNSYTQFVNKIEVIEFRHIQQLEITFDHPITIIAGTNKVGKTSTLLLIACSHHDFLRFDSTRPETNLRRHTWRDVLQFTNHENTTREYKYLLNWRVGTSARVGEAKRKPTSQAWTGVGKSSSDPSRINSQIRNREVRFIDLERISPARNSSNSLLRKIKSTSRTRVHQDVEQAFSYIFNRPDTEIFSIGSHINKTAYLISNGGQIYSSYNAASGEDVVINMLVEIVLAPNNSLIIIDELEAGLHPYIQRKMSDILSYISWNHKKQFIITTHSPSLLAAFDRKSRKFIEQKSDGSYRTISNISVNAAFSKMDSEAYPLVQLYCEDELAAYIIRNIILELNTEHTHFDRFINIISSGPVDQVKGDYERHKRNYPQLRLKIGYCCVFDGDYKDNPQYSNFHENPSEYSFFLYPYKAPEKFLVEAYLQQHPSPELSTALRYADNHVLFEEMVRLGLAVDKPDALSKTWNSFKATPEYTKLSVDLKKFIIDVTDAFSIRND